MEAAESTVKSSVEVESQLDLAKDSGALGEMAWSRLTHQNISVRKMLCALRAKVLAAAADTANAPTRATRVVTAPSAPAHTKAPAQCRDQAGTRNEQPVTGHPEPDSFSR